jgi:DNA-binding IclR family transcriptional regulator
MVKSRAVPERMTDERVSHDRVQSIERGLAILAYLNRAGAGTNSQVSAAFKLKRSTVHRILGVLVDLGLVRHDRLSHQYLLSAGVRELSSGFRDDAWITDVALPQMSAWTLEHHWPLVLVTPVAGALVIRVSTDSLSPISGDRFVAGHVVPFDDSSVGVTYRAWTSGPASSDSEELAQVRAAGHIAHRIESYPGARMVVPLQLDGQFVGSISMRCLPEMIENPGQRATWLAELESLAVRMITDAAPLLGR